MTVIEARLQITYTGTATLHYTPSS